MSIGYIMVFKNSGLYRYYYLATVVVDTLTIDSTINFTFYDEKHTFFLQTNEKEIFFSFHFAFLLNGEMTYDIKQTLNIFLVE